MRKLVLIVRKFAAESNKCHISAYSASAAFFMFLSLIPMLLLICSILPYTPVTEADLMEIMAEILPTSLVPLAINTVADVYDKSPAVISLSAVAIIWSAGKGMLAVIRGLNAIQGQTKPQNYFVQRFRASIYGYFTDRDFGIPDHRCFRKRNRGGFGAEIWRNQLVFPFIFKPQAVDCFGGSDTVFYGVVYLDSQW